MRRALAFLIIILGLGATLRAQSDSASRREALLARAKALELSTPYVPPPGEPLTPPPGEVWVLTERLAAVEALAARQGLAVEDELKSFSFSPEEDATLQAAREQFVRTVLEPLTATSP